MNPAEWGTFAIALSACTGGRSASWQPDPETALVCLKLAEVILSAGHSHYSIACGQPCSTSLLPEICNECSTMF